jgi:hypothetical protein
MQTDEHRIILDPANHCGSAGVMEIVGISVEGTHGL